MNEIWIPTQDDSRYEVSNFGNVRSFANNRWGRKTNPRILKKVRMKNGYDFVSIPHNGKFPHVLVHRLVAQAFIQNLENRRCVNHKNGIKNDNRVENIEWATYHENMVHAFGTGLTKSNFGENAGRAKISEKQARIIKHFLNFGGSGYALAKMMNISKEIIYAIKSGRSWNHIKI